jgi:glycogen debranching enzyme
MLDRLILKENDVFAVTDRDGNIHSQAADGQGLYLGDTRFLSEYDFSIADVPIQLLSSAGELNFMNTFQFANLPAVLEGGLQLPPRMLSIRRNRFIDAGLHERIGFFNYGSAPITLTVHLTFGSDFRDMFDVRGYAERKRGAVGIPEADGDVVRLRYLGRDGVVRTTVVGFDATPDAVELLNTEGVVEPSPTADDEEVDPRSETGVMPPLVHATFRATIPAHDRWSLTIHIAPSVGPAEDERPTAPSLDDSFTRIMAAHGAWSSGCTRITSDNELLNALVRQNTHDLRLTMNHERTGLLPVAGVPWFAVPFGRDSLITALQTLCLNPDVAYGTLRFLASYQGKEVDPWRDEEPGKILHEIRSGEMAALREVPQTPYYGSVDSTPLFVFLVTELLRWTDDSAFADEILPNVEAALEWIHTYGDPDGDGLVEYQSRSARGIRNQGWKDSHDSVSFPDGQAAEPPIAMAEVQGYCYAAEARMAELYDRWGKHDRAAELRRSAEHRKSRFEEAFWMASEGFYAEALDHRKTPVPAITSNPGHCLLMGLIDGARADATVERLMREDMLCGWGIRTLSSQYPTFNPMSYHNGSVWPHDNSLVVAGLRTRGYGTEALRVIQETFDAGFRLPGFRVPELYCGFSRDRRYQSSPATYPVSCTPQSWGAGSVFLMLQHLIGLEPDLPNGRIVLRPSLLVGVNRLVFEDLRIGSRSLRVEVWREGGGIRCEVAGADGLEVVIDPT